LVQCLQDEMELEQHSPYQVVTKYISPLTVRLSAGCRDYILHVLFCYAFTSAISFLSFADIDHISSRKCANTFSAEDNHVHVVWPGGMGVGFHSFCHLGIRCVEAKTRKKKGCGYHSFNCTQSTFFFHQN
jgi:hypothetical protein